MNETSPDTKNGVPTDIVLHDEALLAALRGHIRALAGGIGPRGAATGAEERAFA